MKPETEELKTLQDFMGGKSLDEDDYDLQPNEASNKVLRQLKTEVEKIKDSCIPSQVLFDYSVFGLKMLKFFEMEIEK